MTELLRSQSLICFIRPFVRRVLVAKTSTKCHPRSSCASTFILRSLYPQMKKRDCWHFRTEEFPDTALSPSRRSSFVVRIKTKRPRLNVYVNLFCEQRQRRKSENRPGPANAAKKSASIARPGTRASNKAVAGSLNRATISHQMAGAIACARQAARSLVAN